MQYFKYAFDSVEQYLHHRDPYLMVDRINAISADSIKTEKRFAGTEFFSEGHFPGATVFPGAMLQEISTQSAGILIAAHYNPMTEFDTSSPFANEYALGVLVKVGRAKYTGFVRPGDQICATVLLDDQISNLFDFSASLSVDGRVVMRNAFRLANIKSMLLRG